jgi:hypothetical protein
MNMKFADWVIVLLFGCLVFFHFRGTDLAAGKKASAEDLYGGKMLLFILDFRDFSCSTCLDSFLGFYQKLPLHFRTRGSWGVLMMKTPAEDEGEDSLYWIAEKKLRGFLQANHITFPVMLDRSRAFGALAEKGSGVVLFDRDRRHVLRYDFPLTGEKFEEIFGNLIE